MVAKKNPGCSYAYGWNRFNMRLIGAWPEENQNFFMKNRAYVHSVMVFFLIWLPLTASITFIAGDLKQLISCLVFMIPVGIAGYKLALFRYRREVLVSIYSAMAKDWSMERTNEELEAMLEKARYGRFISITSVSLATVMYFGFTGVGAWEERQERPFITNETIYLRVGFLSPAYCPYDTKEMKRYLPILFSQCFATIFGMFGYSGPDSAMAMMILHLCGQLASVRIALTNIVDEECIKNPSVYWKKLSAIITRHEELNRYGELIEGSFNGMLLIQIMHCIISFCFQGFVTVTALIEGLTGDEDFPTLQITFFVIYSSYTTLHLFMYCWAGDLLVVESTALGYAPYESDWFLLPPAQAKALMMVTNRCRIPLQITAGKFVGFSLQLFTSIMKTSMGYLSVLLAMKDG